MGIASVLVYVYGGGLNGRTLPPLLVYAFQLIVNFAWTPVFFTARESCLVPSLLPVPPMQLQLGLTQALLMIGWIWALVLVCILLFAPINWPAAILMVPYLVSAPLCRCRCERPQEGRGCRCGSPSPPPSTSPSASSTAAFSRSPMPPPPLECHIMPYRYVCDTCDDARTMRLAMHSVITRV